MLFQVLLIVAALISLFALRFFPIPYLWAALTFGCVFGFGFATSKGTWRVLCFNLAIVCLILAGFEGYCFTEASLAPSLQDVAVDSNGNTERSLPHGILGYVPRPNVTVRWRRSLGSSLIFDVSYSIDAMGRRVTPSSTPDSGQCILFFGDSFTFGAGVEDHETLPYRVGVLAAGRFRVHNFGYSGYGPQQTLAALQHGLALPGLGCRPRHAYFLAIDEHARRVSRPLNRIQRPPRYVLRADGSLMYAGNFEANPWAIGDQLRKSHLAKRMVFQLLDVAVNDEDIKLMAATLAESQNLLATLAPGCDFQILYWDTSSTSERIIAALEGEGLQVHRVSRVLPGFATARSRYELSPFDLHPSPLAYSLLADYLDARVLGNGKTTQSVDLR